MQKLKQKRVGIYVRVSTEMQSTEGYSIDGQINQIKEYCNFHHFESKIYTTIVVYQESL